MQLLQALAGLPASLLLLVAAQIDAVSSASPAARTDRLPTAVRKMGLDEGEKFFPDRMMAFAEEEDDIFAQEPLALTPREAVAAARISRQWALSANASREYDPPFAPHAELGDGAPAPSRNLGLDLVRRAAEALRLLQARQSCPVGMNSCASIGSPDKCCMSTEVCTRIEDSSVGNVACCPQGTSCSGQVGPCGSGATSCPADMGGGCCIPGFVCQGYGCVPSASATPTPSPTTSAQTITTTQTTIIDGGSPSTVVVTVIITIAPEPGTTTVSTTRIVTASTETTNTGAQPPFRPTSSESTPPPLTPSTCPTGYYACLARYGGGCCQTGRDCQTTSCPPTPLTTVVDTNGRTVVVPVTQVPAAPSSTCAAGWYMCGPEAGPVPGCCPSSYACGTASCTFVSPESTAEVQKQFPTSAAAKEQPWLWLGALVGASLAFCFLS